MIAPDTTIARSTLGQGTSGTRHTRISSPLGELTLVARDRTLTGISFSRQWYRPDPTTFGEYADVGFEDVTAQLDEYFAGIRHAFDLPMHLDGNEFQQKVWRVIETIPSGETITYGDIARELGDVSLAREVGNAVGHNPVCIVVPCHRVVGKGGKLTGYAGGLDRKRFLLDLEQPEKPTMRSLL